MEQINLNIIPDGVMPVCHASQFDKNRTIRFNLKDNGSVYTLAGTETITCKVRKPDDTENTINVANTSSSYVDVTFGLGDTDLSGYAMCELKIVKGTQTIGSRNFLLNIEADAFDGSKLEERSASGAVASFETNFIDNLTECIVDIDAIQDLHGYSKPWSGGGGKNKLEPCITSGTVNGVSYTANDDGTITLSNTAMSDSKKWGFFDLKAGSYIYTSGVTESLDTYDTFLSIGDTTIARGISGYNSFTLAQDSTVGLTIRVRNGITPNITIKPMIRLPDTSADFEPYENICPISGWSSCNIHKSGINLWDEEWEVGGIHWITGANSSETDRIRSKDYIPVLPNTAYYFASPAIPRYVWFYDFNKNIIEHVSGNNNFIQLSPSNFNFTTPYNACYCRFILWTTYGTTYNNDISINYPSTDHNYHAFNGGTDTISLGDTYYGGTLNVTTGELTITHTLVDLGTLTWTKVTSFTNILFLATVTGKATNNSNIICSNYNNVGIATGGTFLNNMANNSIASDTTTGIYIRDDAKSSLSAADFKTAMSGVQLVYELATPTTAQLTPTEVRTLLEDNNIFADTGDVVSCKYLVEVT